MWHRKNVSPYFYLLILNYEDFKETQVAQNLKPIIDEIKNKIANTNKEQLRDAVLENLKQTRETVEKTIKQVAQQSSERAKDSKLVRDYVIPFAESENADKAIKYLNAKLGSNSIVTRIEQARKSLIDLKVSNVKAAEVVETPEVETPKTEA